MLLAVSAQTTSFERRFGRDGGAAVGQPFGFWATLGLAAVVIVLSVIFAMLTIHSLGSIPYSAEWLAILLVADVAAVVLVVAVLAVSARQRGWTVAGYLGLDWPRPGMIVFGLGYFVIFYLASVAVSFVPAARVSYAESAQTWIALYHASIFGGFAPLVWLAAVAGAPVSEEIVFRGFLQRGWSASRIGVSGGIILASFLWALLHFGYPGIVILDMFVMGLGLGWLRWYTGSTTLTILLHALNNLIAMLMYAAAVHQWW